MRIIISIILIAGFHMLNMGQSLTKGDALLSPHLGIVGEAGDPASRNFPMVLLSYEQMISDLISVGAITGYESRTLENIFTDDEEDINKYIIGVVGSTHLLNNDTMDGYVTVKVGYEGSSGIGGGTLLFDFGGGYRYFVGERFAIFGEAGLAYSVVRAGVSFKM